MAASTSSYLAAGSSTSESSAEQRLQDQVILHKVAWRDTLAGLAVKYNVSILDIKNANGLFTDASMFARDVVVIPPKPAAPGERYSGWWNQYTPPCLATLRARGAGRDHGPLFALDDEGGVLSTGQPGHLTPWQRTQRDAPGDVELADFTPRGRKPMGFCD